jgi:hypothetical protein
LFYFPLLSSRSCILPVYLIAFCVFNKILLTYQKKKLVLWLILSTQNLFLSDVLACSLLSLSKIAFELRFLLPARVLLLF